MLLCSNVTWLGGTYYPCVSTSSNDADLWDCTGTFNIGGIAEIDPTPMSINGEACGTDPFPSPCPYSWSVIHAGGGIAAFPGTPFIIGPYTALFTLPIIGGPPTFLDLTAN